MRRDGLFGLVYLVGGPRAPPPSARAPTGVAPVTAAPVPASAIESAGAASDLFDRYHDRVYAFCMSRTRNPTDAEDATQTAFMYALNGLRRGVVPRFELTWLLRIAENVCHSMHRRAYRRYERDELSPDAMSGQDDIALVTERFETLCLALESLPEKQRRAILLREWRGLSYTEIADELDISHSAVETMLFRARRALGKQFGPLVVLPFPAIGRFARWIGGPGSAKAAAVTAVTIGAATGVVSSTPVVEPGQRAQSARAKPADTPPLRQETRATPVRPGARLTPVPSPPDAAPNGPARAPRSGGDRTGPSTPVASIDPRVESPTPQPAGVVNIPTPGLPVAVPVDPAEPLAPVTELTNTVTDELEQVLETELPPLVPELPLPELPLP
jgi:RNA polymerase sigma-70 factor (ECF subfamily)